MRWKKTRNEVWLTMTGRFKIAKKKDNEFRLCRLNGVPNIGFAFWDVLGEYPTLADAKNEAKKLNWKRA